MKKTTLNSIVKFYPSLFTIGLLTFLFLFVPLSGAELSKLSENFRWRKELISAFTSFRMRMGDKVFNQAVVGKDGWLFYTAEEILPDYEKTNLIQRNQLESLQQELDQLNSDLQKQGITLLVVIPPDKSTVYSQYMPDEILVLGKTSRLDQFTRYMKRYGETTVIDLRPSLAQASQSSNVYNKTDTHWNDLGAHIGYVEIMKQLSSAYPELSSRPLSDFKYVDGGTVASDIPKIMGLSNYQEENFTLVPNFQTQLSNWNIPLTNGPPIEMSTNSEKNLPRVLVYHDSFYKYLKKFMDPHFSQVVAVPYTGSKDVWNLKWIQSASPDIVIIELTERYLFSGLYTLLSN